MARFFLEIAYNGTGYHGWQIQPNGMSVQEKIQEMLRKMYPDSCAIVGSGRTDTGVHALQQIAHWDVPDEDFKLTEADLHYKLNRMLPEDIAIHSVKRVKDDAHARFDAVRRTYHYHISFLKDPFRYPHVHLVREALDIEAMNQACDILREYDDFSSFCKAHADNKTMICKVFTAEWLKEGESHWKFIIAADRFLRNMVRAIVGTLLEVGRGNLKPADIRAIIEAKDRSKAGESVSARGLFLAKVEYPEDVFLS